MEIHNLVQRLSAGVAAAKTAARFCVHGSLPDLGPGLKVKGVGEVKFPLDPDAAQRLMAECRQAPFGQGTKTLVDKSVRNTFELAPERFAITDPRWDEAVRAVVRSVAKELGLPPERLEPQLYKLLVYGKGGFFKPHRDSEKIDGMVGSLIIVLPNPFQGGELCVRHQNAQEHFGFEEAANGRCSCFAAFYADCEHEVLNVLEGVRVCLTYNLVLKAADANPQSDLKTPSAELAESISGWFTVNPAEPLVFALDHHYTARGLKLDLLKGNDRSLAELVVAAAELAGGDAHLCQVSRHLLMEANDGSYPEEYDEEYDEDDADAPDVSGLELGEIYDDELVADGWVDAEGKAQSLPKMDFASSCIVASSPVEEWKPDRQEYEGFTGNEGNTLERWYHRSALCVWHRDQHFDVLAVGAFNDALELLESMLKKLPKTAKKRAADARAACLQLAQALIRHWKSQPYQRHHESEERPKIEEFPAWLKDLNDPETVRRFLEAIAGKSPEQELDALIVAACRNHRCDTFAEELLAQFQGDNSRCWPRDHAWLEALAVADFADEAKTELTANLGKTAGTEFCRFLSASTMRLVQAEIEAIIPRLVHTLVLTRDDATLKSVVEAVGNLPKRWPVQAIQVAALSTILRSLAKGNKENLRHPLLLKWMESLRDELKAATTEEPQPPTDWARPAGIVCRCDKCVELRDFLSDPKAKTGRIKAREDLRNHLAREITSLQFDVTHTLDMNTTPRTLVLTKTKGSYERCRQRYADDRKLLRTLEGLLSMA